MYELTVNDILIKINVSDRNISRVDVTPIYRMTQNYAFIQFTFSEHWSNLTPAIILKHNYAVGHYFLDENGIMPIPNEMLQEVGTIEVSVMAGNLRTINSTFISVVESGFAEESPPKPPLATHVYVKTPNNSTPIIREDLRTTPDGITYNVFQYFSTELNDYVDVASREILTVEVF